MENWLVRIKAHFPQMQNRPSTLLSGDHLLLIEYNPTEGYGCPGSPQIIIIGFILLLPAPHTSTQGGTQDVFELLGFRRD